MTSYFIALNSTAKFYAIPCLALYTFSSLFFSSALCQETPKGYGSVNDEFSVSTDFVGSIDLPSIDSFLDSVSQPISIQPLNDYKIVTFGDSSFACIDQDAVAAAPALSRSRCIPFDSSKDSFSLGFRDTVVRSIFYSPKFYSTLNDVESQSWLVRQTFSSWYPNVSISSGSLLQANSVYTSNYESTSSGSSNPSASGTAFQASNALSGDNSSTASSSSTVSSIEERVRDLLDGNSSSDTGLTDPTTTFSSYLQGYPILTLTWSFLDPTRADKINAAKFSLTSSQKSVESTARDIAYSVANLYGSILAQEYAISGYLLQAVSAQELLEIYENQFEAGLLPINQLLTQKSELEQIKFNLILASSQRDSYIQQLLPLIGLDQPYSQLFLPQQIQLPSGWPLSEDATVRLIERYPSLLSLNAQASQMSSLAKSSRKSYLPTLSVLAYMTYVGTRGSSSSFPPGQPQGAWSSQFSTYAGLNLTWQLFDGFSQFQQSKSYMAQSRSYAEQLDNELQDLTSQAMGSIALLNRSTAGFASLNSSYEASVLALSSETRRSQSGFSDPIASLQAEQALGQVVSSYSSYYEQIYGSLMSLLKLTGLNLDQLFD